MLTRSCCIFRMFALWLPLFALFTFNTSCTKSGKGSDQILEYGNAAEPQDLDPQIVTGIPEHHILIALFEGLIQVDPKTLEPIPGVAESWTISKDGKTYTFKLRKDAKWTNGDPVTAHDFVYSWRRLVDPKTAAKYAYHGYYLKNGREINKRTKVNGKVPTLEQLGVRAADDYTLVAELESPAPFFLGLLYHYSWYPVHKKTVEKHGQRWTRLENIVTNGPFKLKSWELHKVMTLVKNPSYWDAKTVRLKQINYYPVEDLNTEEKMFRAKKLHVTREVPIAKIPYWKEGKKEAYQEHPYLGSYYYRINITKPALKDKRVRRALNLTVDRDRIVRLVTKGGQIPALAYTPPGTGGFNPTPKLNPKVTPENIKEAKKLLADAGYPNGKGLPKIEILYNTHENHRKIAEAIQEMWRTNLGVKVGIYNQEWKVYLASMQTLNYQIARAGWIGDYNDPLTFLEMFITDGGNNETGFSNAKYDALVQAARVELDHKKRLVIFQQLEDILMDELPMIPIYTYTRVYLKHPSVKGWFANVMDYHPFKFVYLQP